MTGENVLWSQPLGRGIEQDLLQRAAMHRELRPFVTGLEAARLAPDRLAVFGEIRQLPGAHAGRIELVEQAELGQFAHRMGQHVDADPERFQLSHALEHACRNADLVQAERQGQPADAAAGDEYGHDGPSLSGMVMAWEAGRGQQRKPGRLAWSGWTAQRRAANLRLPNEDQKNAQALLCPGYLRAGLAYRAGGSRRRLQRGAA